MKIKFKNLKIKNFLSFESAELTLSDLGYTLVNGVNENPDDLAKSNGSGKSSLFDAINWCLTGETIRGTKDVVRLGSKGGCEVNLTCLINNDLFEITRSKDPSNLKVMVNGQDKSGKGIRDTQKLLEDYLPDLTPELIGSVIILGQGLPQRFSNNTPSGRKEVLEKLSKSDFMLQDIKDKLSNRKTYLNSIVRTLEDDLLKLNTRKEILSKNINDNNIRLSSMSSDVYESGIKQTKDFLTEEKRSLDDITSSLSTLTKDRDVLNDDKLKKSDDYHNKVQELEESYKDEIKELNTKVVTKDTEIRDLSSRILELKSIKDVCPTCGQKLPNVHKVDTTDLEDKLLHLKEEKSSISIKLNDVETSLNEAKNSLKTSFIDSTKELDLKLNDLNETINKNQLEKDRISRIVGENEIKLSKLEADLDNFNDNKFKLERAIEQDKSELMTIEEKMLYNNNELDGYKDRLEINGKMFNLITRDFRGYLLTNVISFINNKSKEYSLELFETDKVDFILDGNNIDIYYDNKPYECLSGGERQKIDVIVQLAIRDMLCTHLDFSSNILVLDEISDNIDSVGAEKLFNLISNKLTDVESVFIISHHSDYSLPIDNMITVVKGPDKISRIV